MTIAWKTTKSFALSMGKVSHGLAKGNIVQPACPHMDPLLMVPTTKPLWLPLLH